MGKLIKYEFRKQMLSKAVVGVLIAILEIVYLAGVLFENGDWAAIGLGGTIILAFAALFYFSFETIVTYSNDLKTKQSYMLFLTPRNMFQIVGAKMITTVLQIIVVGAAFVAIIIGDIFFLSVRVGEVKEFIEMMKLLFQAFTGIEVEMLQVVVVLVMVLVVWLEFVLMAMFAITLSTTFFANKKYKGVISVAIYFAVEFIIGKLANIVMPDTIELAPRVGAFIGLYVVTMILCFLGNSWLLEKKVSV